MRGQKCKLVTCLLVPKALFQEDRFSMLSTTAKVLYSLLLDRLKYAELNGWIDKMNQLYVMYPKSEMMKDLNCTRYQVEHAIKELERQGNMVKVVKDNGKSNCFYVNNISNREEKKDMMLIKELLDLVKPEDRERIMNKISETAHVNEEELINSGSIQIVRAKRSPETHVDKKEESEDLEYDEFVSEDFDPMTMRGYLNEKGALDEEAIEADASEFGVDLAFGVKEFMENDPDRIEDIRNYFNSIYEKKSMKKFMSVVETTAILCGNSPEWIEDMHVCNKAARRVYLKELLNVFNMYLEMFKNKELE